MQLSEVLHESITGKNNSDTIRFSNILFLPHGLKGYFFYTQGIIEAKEKNRPIFLEFTCHSCSNPQRMAEVVLGKPEILKRLRENFIIISLYVDERFELPKNEWMINNQKELLKTLGQQNYDLQVSKYKSEGQPCYYIIDSNEKVLSYFKGYNPDVRKFAAFLDEGKSKFGK